VRKRSGRNTILHKGDNKRRYIVLFVNLFLDDLEAYEEIIGSVRD
jgi:hypothetical protein